MVYQSGRNISVNYKLETTYGEKPGATGATGFRPNSGSINLTKEPINSNEVRSDGMSTRGRHGSRSVTGSYTGDLSVGTFDALFEAAFRGTWSSALSLTQATSGMATATISTTTNTIVASAGSWITVGLRVGDVIRLGTGFVTGNQNRNVRITALTATVITVAETLTAQAGPVASWAITRPKTLIQGTTPRSFTFEEYEADIDGVEVFKGVRVGSVQLQMQPNGMATVNFGLVGQDMEVLDGASAPYFTNPTKSTTVGLTAVEAKIMLGSEQILDVSSIDMTLNLNAAGVPVVGSVYTPDVFTNLASVELSITALKKDTVRALQFLNETELSLHLLFEENETGARDFVAFYIPNMTLATATKGELGQDNARTEQFTCLVGVDERGGANDKTMVKLQTSAA